MVDAYNGGLEDVYQAEKRRNRSMDEGWQLQKGEADQAATIDIKDQLFSSSKIDRTGYILQSLKKSTPATNVNLQKVKQIKSQAKSKVAYAYKERYSGVYEDRMRKGLLKKENSMEKFLEPTQLGMNNPIQHALHSEMSEIRKLEENAKKNGMAQPEQLTS